MPIIGPEDLASFTEQGFIHVPQVVSKEKCEAVIAALFEFLGMDRDNPEDWYRSPLKPGGMVELYQHQALWDTRQEPRVHSLFSDLLGTEKLWVTIDRAGFKPPRHAAHPEYDHKGFIHWDVDTSRLPVRFGVQGVLYLTDTSADQGGFQCIPGFHRNLEEWIRTQPEDRDPRVPDTTGLNVTPIPGKAGDMVIWSNLLAHGNGHNVSGSPRFSQYISMFPAPPDGQGDRDQRVKCWRDHCPPGTPIFPGDPRALEQSLGRTAELTALGRRLLGVDPWP